MPDYSDNKFGSRKLRRGLKITRKDIIDGDGYLTTKVKANLWAHSIKEGIDRYRATTAFIFSAANVNHLHPRQTAGDR